MRKIKSIYQIDDMNEIQSILDYCSLMQDDEMLEIHYKSVVLHLLKTNMSRVRGSYAGLTNRLQKFPLQQHLVNQLLRKQSATIIFRSLFETAYMPKIDGTIYPTTSMLGDMDEVFTETGIELVAS